MKFSFAAVIAVACLCGQVSSQALTLTLGQLGPDVYMEWTGSLTTLPGTASAPFAVPQGEFQSQFDQWSAYACTNAIFFNPGPSDDVTFNFQPIGVFPDLPADEFEGDSCIGMQFQEDSTGFIVLTAGYTPGDTIQGCMTFSDQTFASIGINDGVTSTVSYNGQTITFTSDVNAFPAGYSKCFRQPTAAPASPTSAPTPNPIDVPTKAPMTAPTTAPVITPTTAPVIVTPAPSKAPTQGGGGLDLGGLGFLGVIVTALVGVFSAVLVGIFVWDSSDDSDDSDEHVHGKGRAHADAAFETEKMAKDETESIGDRLLF